MLASAESTYADIMTSVFSTTIAGKAWFATAAVLLALVQVTTAARIFGHLEGVVRLPYEQVKRIHRWSGRLAFLCTLPVAFHCIFMPLVGGTLFAALVALWLTSAYWYFTNVRFGV
ncbi:MAG: DUF6529 family protein [Gaiellaceae bacterium]